MEICLTFILKSSSHTTFSTALSLLMISFHFFVVIRFIMVGVVDSMVWSRTNHCFSIPVSVTAHLSINFIIVIEQVDHLWIAKSHDPLIVIDHLLPFLVHYVLVSKEEIFHCHLALLWGWLEMGITFLIACISILSISISMKLLLFLYLYWIFIIILLSCKKSLYGLFTICLLDIISDWQHFHSFAGISLLKKRMVLRIAFKWLLFSVMRVHVNEVSYRYCRLLLSFIGVLLLFLVNTPL